MSSSGKKKALITGGAGFVGAHFVEHFHKNTDWDIVILDKLNYSGSLERLRDIDVYPSMDIQFFAHDIVNPIEGNLLEELKDVTHVIHMAAESHVDNSIEDPMKFVMSNVVGTTNMLNLARNLPNLKLFINFSCYDEKTRALTKDGLKYYHELSSDDIVFSVEEKTGELVENPIEEIIIQDYEGDMIEFSGKRMNMLVTPNHRMYYKSTDSEEILWEEASTLKDKDVSHFKPKKWQGKPFNTSEFSFPVVLDTEEKKKAFLYVCGAFLGDGFTAYQEKVRKTTKHRTRCATTGRFIWVDGPEYKSVQRSFRIWFDIPEKDPARQRLVKALKTLNVSFTEQNNKSGEHVYFTSKEWLNFFDSTFGKGASNKRTPFWLKSLDSTYLKPFFEGLIDSDGHRNPQGSIFYHTVSDKLASDLVEVGFKLGYHPRISKRVEGGNFLKAEKRFIKKGEAHVVWFAHNAPNYMKKHNKTVEGYKGKVWCLKLKEGYKNFIVEREGVFALSGNTDEVFGPATMDDLSFKGFTESDAHNPKNPYAATKSGAEQMVTAFANTFGLKCVITRQMNIFGERQHPEKFIPLCIKAALEGGDIKIHATPDKKSAGLRHYIHARNVADAHLHLLKEEPYKDINIREVDSYHVVGEEEVDNLSLALLIEDLVKEVGGQLKLTPKGYSSCELVDFHSSRSGHDLRYALDGTKMAENGWEPPKTFRDSLKKTVEWYLKEENKRWLNL